jgi:hypothetical protein
MQSLVKGESALSAVNLDMGLGARSAATVGDDCDLKILSHADNVLRVILALQPLSKASLGVSHKNLCHLIATGEFDHRLGDIAAAQDLRCDL